MGCERDVRTPAGSLSSGSDAGAGYPRRLAGPATRRTLRALTSGSTGQPKLVIGSRSRAERLAAVIHDAQEYEPVRHRRAAAEQFVRVREQAVAVHEAGRLPEIGKHDWCGARRRVPALARRTPPRSSARRRGYMGLVGHSPVSLAVGVEEVYGYHTTPEEATGPESIGVLVTLLRVRGIDIQ